MHRRRQTTNEEIGQYSFNVKENLESLDNCINSVVL